MPSGRHNVISTGSPIIYSGYKNGKVRQRGKLKRIY